MNSDKLVLKLNFIDQKINYRKEENRMNNKSELTVKQREREKRLQWFKQARFGMFIHWGLYAQLERHEWVMNRERIPVKEYEKLADTWKPKVGAPRKWAKMAKKAGMKYMVMTAKHHEGFCLFDSKLTDYNAVQRGPGRDLVTEYVEAVRAEGLKVGLYFSLKDWHHSDGMNCNVDDTAYDRFIKYVHGQVKELCSNYGKIDILWYDGSWPFDAEGWQAAKMNRMVRKMQPEIIINNRSGLPEDFGTPENKIKPEKGERAWESCMTFNHSWGYTPIDNDYKNAGDIIDMLRQVASGGGNLLLNIGPAPDGSVPVPCKKALVEVGDWLNKYGQSIYEATDPMERDWSIIGAFTAKDNIAYYHCYNWPGSKLVIGGLRNKVLKVKFMGGEDIKFEQENDRLILSDLPQLAPDPLVTVLEIEVEGKPHQEIGPGMKLLKEIRKN